MTRKRTRESLLHTLAEPCQYCEGKGYSKSRKTIAYEIFRELRRQGWQRWEIRQVFWGEDA